MSVTTTTPSPSSTAATAASISACFEPQSSSASIDDRRGARAACRPHAPCAARYSRARPPCATITIPITLYPLPDPSRVAGRPLQVPMPNRHLPPVRRKRFRKRLDHRHRPVPAAGAAEAEAEIALSLRPIGRQQEASAGRPAARRTARRPGRPRRRPAPPGRARRAAAAPAPSAGSSGSARRSPCRRRAARRACRRRTAASPPARRAASSSPNCRAISARRSCGVIALVSISTSARAAQRREQRQLALDADERRLVRAERMAPPGLAVAPHQRRRRRSRDRRAPAPARSPPRPRRAPRAAASTANSRLRGSIPITTGRSIGAAGEEPRQEADAAGCRSPRSRDPRARRSRSTARRPPVRS